MMSNMFVCAAYILTHPTSGAANFLQMVQEGFFSSKVALFRAIKGFLIQFGLSGSPTVQRSFEKAHMSGMSVGETLCVIYMSCICNV